MPTHRAIQPKQQLTKADSTDSELAGGKLVSPRQQHHYIPDGASQSKPKRRQTHIACNACRSARAKCDGKRPCSRCSLKHSGDCAYEVNEGETRMSSLRKRVSLLEDEVAFLRNLINTGWDTSQDDLRQRVHDGPRDGCSNLRDGNRSPTSPIQSFSPPDTGSGDGLHERFDKKREQSRPPLITQNSSMELSDGYDSTLSQVISGMSDNVDPQLMRVNRNASSIEFLDSAFSFESPPSYVVPDSFQQLQGFYDTALNYPSLLGDFSEQLDDHIAILAVTKGWAAVRTMVQLDTQWGLIACIDPFHLHLRMIDRLAVIRVLRMMIKYHAQLLTGSEVVDNSVPEWAKSTPMQLTGPYPNLIQFLFWPSLRDQLIVYPSLLTGSFYTALYASIRLACAASNRSVASVTDSSQQPFLRLNSQFLDEIKDLRNWSVTGEFLDKYPMFVGTIPRFLEERNEAVMDGGWIKKNSRADGKVDSKLKQKAGQADGCLDGVHGKANGVDGMDGNMDGDMNQQMDGEGSDDGVDCGNDGNLDGKVDGRMIGTSHGKTR